MTDFTTKKIDIDKFVANMHFRLKNKLCLECSIHATRTGPSFDHTECHECHNVMEAASKSDE